MRIATWNVNSLKARLDKAWWWLERAQPDVLLLQETKLTDADAPIADFMSRGYELVHHGQGRWNGVAIASRVGVTDVVSNFGEPLRPPETPEVGEEEGQGSPKASADVPGGVRAEGAGGPRSREEEGQGSPKASADVPGGVRAEGAGGPRSREGEPFAEARMVSAVCGGVRVVSVYAPNGRVVDSEFYEAKLVWFDRLAKWLGQACDPSADLVLGGDLNVAPADADVWDPVACHGGTHVSKRERDAFARLCAWGLVDAYRLRHAEQQRYSWWDYRAGMFHKNYGMRIDHLLVTESVAPRVVWAEIDREARKGKPTPSDHAPVLIDLDEPGVPLDAGWEAAEARIAARQKPPKRKRQG